MKGEIPKLHARSASDIRLAEFEHLEEEGIMYCPFVDSGDIRCRIFHTLQNIDKALGRCAGEYCKCRVYRKKMDEPIDTSGRTMRFAI